MIEWILNVGWNRPLIDVMELWIIILLTLTIEGGLVAFYCYFKKLDALNSIILIVVTFFANFISGIVGWLLGSVL